MLSTATSFTRYKMRCFEKKKPGTGKGTNVDVFIYLIIYVVPPLMKQMGCGGFFLQYVEREFLTVIYYASHSTLIYLKHH